MFSFNLLNQWQKIAIVAITSLLLLVALYLGAAVRIKSTTAVTSSACAKVSVSPGSDFTMLAAQSRNAYAADEVVGDGVEIITTDILLYPTTIISAEGHPVYISGETSAQSGRFAYTTIWVDENENGRKDNGEYLTVRSSVAASYYIYGGSDTLAVNSKKISITMTGGEIGAIFAGGQYQNVTTANVDIQITGGSVQYVDCGSQCGPLGENLTATGSINVLLKDCIYRSNIPVSFLEKNSHKSPSVTVRDFSTHRNAQSYNRHYPTFNNYIAPIGLDSYVFGGDVTVPADRNIQANKLVLADSAVVNNLGVVSVASCKDIYRMGNGNAIWRGNPIETVHNEGDIKFYDYKTHTRVCKDCGQVICNDHIWLYNSNGDGKSHATKCAICAYVFDEQCSFVAAHDNDYFKQDVCKYCRYATTTLRKAVSYNATCTHSNASSISTVSISKHHVVSEPEGLKDYTIDHDAAKYCNDCKQMLPFTLTYGGKEYYFSELKKLSEFVATKGIAIANVKMNCDALNNYKDDYLYTTGTINLDMNGCDYSRYLTVQSGTINITNSKFVDPITKEEHYAYMDYGNLNGLDGATISIDGCFVEMIYVGADNFKNPLASYSLGNVIVANLYINDVTKFSPTGKIKITERLSKNQSFLGDYMPAGHVFMECLGNGSWVKRFNRSGYWSSGWQAGPANDESKIGFIGFMPCPKHKLNTATSNSSLTHTGNCIYCDASVKMDHDLSAGVDSNDSLHVVKCNICAYQKTSTRAYHDYDENGKCLVPGCNHVAAVSVHGQYSPLKTYFHTFDDALEAVNVAGMYDTITMYSDQYVKQAITLDKKLVKVYNFRALPTTLNRNLLSSAAVRNADFDSSDYAAAPAPRGFAPAAFISDFAKLDLSSFTSMGPKIYIDGGQQSLTKSTSGSINVNGMTANTHFRLEMSGNPSKFTNSLPITAAPGYSFGTKTTLETNIIPCNHSRTHTYESIEDEYSTSKLGGTTKYTAEHKKICPTCNRVVYEKHTFVDETVTLMGKGTITVNRCEKCKAPSANVIAARVMWETTENGVTTEHLQVYKTLTEAWTDALDISVTNSVECTIQVLADIDLQKETGSTTFGLLMSSAKSTAKLVLDAIDDEGREHTIKGTSNASYVISALYGQLTINSGIYVGIKNAVKTNDTAKLRLYGGTFLSATTGYSGLVTAGDYSLLRKLNYAYAISYALPKGAFYDAYIAARPNPVKAEKGNMPKYEPLLIKEVSGTVIPCPHSYYTEYKAIEPTCTSDGRPKYYFCNICKYYFRTSGSAYSVTGEVLDDGAKYQKMGTIASLGHKFGSDHRCSRCDVYENGIVYAEYDATGKLVQSGTDTGFASVWNKVQKWDNAAPEGYTYKVRLLADETMPEGRIINPYTYKHPITVDLNGCSLYLGSSIWQGDYPHLTIQDSRHSGKSVLIGSFRKYPGEKTLVLDGVTYRTSDLACPNLKMVNKAILVMDGGTTDNANIVLKNISMENGCELQGDGCSHFFVDPFDVVNSVNEYDPEDVLADLSHTTTMTQQNRSGEWQPARGTGRLEFVTLDAQKKIYVRSRVPNTSYVYDAKNCYRWRAGKEDVEHILNGRTCSLCGQGNTHQSMILYSGYEKYTDNAVNRSYKELSYRRYGLKGVWESLYLPFKIAPGEHTDEYDLADIYSFGRLFDTNGNGRIDDGDETWLIVDLMTSGETEPNYPYLVRSKVLSPQYYVASDNYGYPSVANSVSCSNRDVRYTFIGTKVDDGQVTLPSGSFTMSSDKLTAAPAATKLANSFWYMQPTQLTGNSSGAAELRQALSAGIRVMIMGEDISEETAIRLLQGETVEVDLDGQHYTLDGRKATTTESGLKIVNGKKVFVTK